MQEKSHDRIWGKLGTVGLLALCCLLCACGGAPAAPQEETAGGVRLNEVMASNNVYYAPDGGLYDWIELYDPGPEDADLSGWALSDKANEARYVFPQGTVLPAGGYLTVYCSPDGGTGAAAPFGISAKGGESVYLFRPDGTAADHVDVPPMAKGYAYQLGAEGWAVTLSPTPGRANVYAPEGELTPDAALRLTELMASGGTTLRDADGDYSDWVELCNTGDKPLDTEGWFLSDDPTERLQWRLPARTLEPGERLVVFCSGKDRTQGELHANFALFREGGGVYLTAPNGAEADRMVYEALEKEQVLRRTAEGAEELSYEATPGYANTEQGREAFIAAHDAPGALVINEAAAYNSGKYTDNYGNACDWVELKNASQEPLTLSDYTLTNDELVPGLFPLPEVTLQPGELYVLFCAEDVTLRDRNRAYAPFNIGSGGERLYLYAADGSLSDCVYVRDLTYGGSIGRLPGESGFFLFEKPSPEKENALGARRKAGPVTADVAPGIYNGVESLTVTLSGEGTIHYTTDGSVPTRESPVYTEPFTLTKTGVFRALSEAEGKAIGDSAAFSYIINENHTLPVLSLVCDPRGIRNILSLYFTECDGVLSLFSEEGTEFSHGCSIRIHGASSLLARQKKMLMVEFNGRFGGNLQCDVFQNGWITEFSSLLLRGETAEASMILRDSVAAEVANRVCDTVLTLQNRYCVLYINGSYYGLYPLREDYSRQYMASHSGSTPESCYVVKGPVKYYSVPGTDIYDTITTVINGNMAVAKNYAWAAERLDMTAMADWLLLEGYFCNLDTGGNVRYLYGDNTGGKWRPGFFDLDIALAGSEPSFYPILSAPDQVNWLMRSLVRSPEFQSLLAERAVVMLDNGLADNVALQVIEQCEKELEGEIPRDAKRWGYDVYEWTKAITGMKYYFSDRRTALFIDRVAELTGLTAEQKQEMFGRFLPAE